MANDVLSSSSVSCYCHVLCSNCGSSNYERVSMLKVCTNFAGCFLSTKHFCFLSCVSNHFFLFLEEYIE